MMMRIRKNRAAALIVALCLLFTTAVVWAGRDLRTNTDTVVTVGPFYDVLGLAIETALTIANERITATVDHNNGTAVVLVLDNLTASTSGTANDLNYVTGNDAGLMQLELAAANVNYLGRFFLTITDSAAANHIPVFHEFNIISAAEWDRKYGSTIANVNVTHVNGTAQTGRDLGAGVNVTHVNGTTQTGRDLGAGVNVTHVSGTVQTGVNLAEGQTAILGHLNGTLEAGSHINSTAQAAAINALLGTAHGNGSWDAVGTSDPAPSAADVAAEVWNTTAASHPNGTTMGGVLNNNTAPVIDAELSRSHGPGSWVK